MDCYEIRRVLAAYCEGLLTPEQSREVDGHLAGCRGCAFRSRQYTQLRSALRQLPVLRPPAQLLISLRILASKERVRHLAPAGVPAWLASWITRTRLWADAIMKPLALPAAGGLASALVLFALLAPGLAVQAPSGAADVPITLFTNATFLGMGPFGYTADDIVLDVTVDSRGSLIDYSSPAGHRAWLNDPVVRRSVENALLFAVISPGTAFGQPVAGKVRITLRRSSIDVRG